MTKNLALFPLTSEELAALWDRWYHCPDPDKARLTDREMLRLFETIWCLRGTYRTMAVPDRTPHEGRGDGIPTDIPKTPDGNDGRS